MKWLQREGIKPTSVKDREIWKAAQVESKVWNSNDNWGHLPHEHIDLRAAYLGSEDSLLGGVSEAMDLVRQYRFPTNVFRRANVNGVSINGIRALTGAIQLCEWAFSPSCHPYTVGRIGQHLRDNGGWITTPELADLLSSGDMVNASPNEVIYRIGVKDQIKFPADRDLAVCFVGKCARRGDCRAFWSGMPTKLRT
jgi:hypothetical protein